MNDKKKTVILRSEMAGFPSILQREMILPLFEDTQNRITFEPTPLCLFVAEGGITRGSGSFSRLS